jgi:hypothetical protein
MLIAENVMPQEKESKAADLRPGPFQFWSGIEEALEDAVEFSPGNWLINRHLIAHRLR